MEQILELERKERKDTNSLPSLGCEPREQKKSACLLDPPLRQSPPAPLRSQASFGFFFGVESTDFIVW